MATALLLLAPSALAVPVHPVVYSAPYHGAKTGTSSAWSVDGCGSATLSVAAGFNASTGFGAFGEKAFARGCANPVGSGGSASNSFTTEIPIRAVATNGAVTAVFTATGSVGSHVKPGSCTTTSGTYSSCYVYADAYASAYAYVYDRTTGNYYYSTTYWAGAFSYSFWDHFCYNGTCNTTLTQGGVVSVSTTGSFDINVTNVSTSDHLWLIVTFGGSVYASASAYNAKLSGGAAKGSVDFGSASNGIDIASITVT